MSKTSVPDFDTDVCLGRRDDVSGQCPKLAGIDEDTGHGMVDKLARIEGKAMDATGVGGGGEETDYKCGLCGCPLVNLALTDQAPSNCVRLEKHQ